MKVCLLQAIPSQSRGFHFNKVIVKETLRLQPNWNEKSKSLDYTLEYKGEKRDSALTDPVDLSLASTVLG